MAARARLLLLFTLLGLVATSWSTWAHYRLLQSPTVTSACDLSATVSCSDAYRSAYSMLGGVPVAALGVCWFAGLLLLQLGGRLGVPPAPHVPGYVFVLAVPALALTAYLAYASWFVLHVVCLLCLTTYVAVAGLFLVSGFSTRFSMTSPIERLARDLHTLRTRPAAVAVVAVFFGAVVAVLGFFPKEPSLSAAFPAPSASPAELPAAGAAAPAPSSEQQENVQAQLQQDPGHAAAPRHPRRRARCLGGRRQIQRLPVPAVQADLRFLQADQGQVGAAGARPGQVHHQGLRPGGGMQHQRAAWHPRPGLRGGGRGPYGPQEQQGGAARGLDLRQPGRSDARRPQEGGA